MRRGADYVGGVVGSWMRSPNNRVNAADTVANLALFIPDDGRGHQTPFTTKEKSMRKLLLIATASAVLAGCASGPMYTARSGGGNPYHSETGSPNDWSQPYYNDHYWPPVDPTDSIAAAL